MQPGRHARLLADGTEDIGVDADYLLDVVVVLVRLLQVVEYARLEMLPDELGARPGVPRLRVLLPDSEGLPSLVEHLLLATCDLVAQDVDLVLQLGLEDLPGPLEVVLLLASRVDGAAPDEVVGVEGPRDQVLPRLRIVHVGRRALGWYLALKQPLMVLGAATIS